MTLRCRSLLAAALGCVVASCAEPTSASGSRPDATAQAALTEPPARCGRTFCSAALPAAGNSLALEQKLLAEADAAAHAAQAAFTSSPADPFLLEPKANGGV